MPPPKLLVLGATGLLGAVVCEAAISRGLAVIAAARSGPACVDIRNEAQLIALLQGYRPDWIVNAAAEVSVEACERDPAGAWMVNARPAAVLAAYAHSAGARLVQVSTDHFFHGDGAARHDEAAPVTLLNDYARSKFAAEALALTDPSALVLRTNMVGIRSRHGGSFGEWARRLIETDGEGVLFADQYVSLLDVWSLADALLDLAATPATGVLNLGSREVFSKEGFVLALAAALGRTLTRAKAGSSASLVVPRPDSLGLDVSRAETWLGRPLPNLHQVVHSLAVRIQADPAGDRL